MHTLSLQSEQGTKPEDYIAVSDDLPNGMCHYYLPLKGIKEIESDHEPMWSATTLPTSIAIKQRHYTTAAGWRPPTDAAVLHNVCETMGLQNAVGIHSFANTLTDSARCCPSSRADNKRQMRQEDVELRCKLREAEGRQEKTQIARQFWSLRRHWGKKRWAERMMQWGEGQWGWKSEFRKRRRRRTTALSKDNPDDGGIPVADQDAWGPIVKDFYDKIYGDETAATSEFTTLMVELHTDM